MGFKRYVFLFCGLGGMFFTWFSVRFSMSTFTNDHEL
jgi:hypothetical protein